MSFTSGASAAGRAPCTLRSDQATSRRRQPSRQNAQRQMPLPFTTHKRYSAPQLLQQACFPGETDTPIANRVHGEFVHVSRQQEGHLSSMPSAAAFRLRQQLASHSAALTSAAPAMLSRHALPEGACNIFLPLCLYQSRHVVISTAS